MSSVDRDFYITLNPGVNSIASLTSFFEATMVADIEAAFLDKLSSLGGLVKVNSWADRVEVVDHGDGTYTFGIDAVPVMSKSPGESEVGLLLESAIQEIEDTVRPKLEALGVTITRWHSH